MGNTPRFQQPAKKAVSDNDGYKYAIVEKLPENWGLGDPVDEFKERGYEIVTDGPRRVKMRIPMEQFQAMERKAIEEGENRLRSTDGLGKVNVRNTSGVELKDSLPDVNELDG